MAMRIKNIQQGYVDATGFHPIRASTDYDEGRVSQYRPKAKPKAKKKAVKKAAKKAVKKTTTRRRVVAKAPAKRASGGLRAYALAASKSRTGGRRGVAMSRNPRGIYSGLVKGAASKNRRLLEAYKVDLYGPSTIRETSTGYVLMVDPRDKPQLNRLREGYKAGTWPPKQNPIPVKWTQAKVMRTKTGDIKVMLTGKR